MFKKRIALLFLFGTNLLLGMISDVIQTLPREISNIITKNVQVGKQWWYCKPIYDMNANWLQSMSWSHDGTHLATASQDNKARIFDVKTKELLVCFDHTDWVQSVCWSNDGAFLATGSKDKRARIFDVKKQQLLMCFDHTSSVQSIDWSNDGTRLATASFDKKAQIFDIKNQILFACFHHDADLCSVRWNRDSTRLATASRDNKARIFDMKTKKLFACFDHNAWVYSIAWSSDNACLAVGCHDENIRIFNVETKQLLTCFNYNKGHSPVLVNLSNNWVYLAIHESMDKGVQVFDAKRKQRLAGFKHPTYVYNISWSNDDRCLATASYDKIRIFERYENPTLAQLSLKYALLNWLLIEKPDKRMIEESYTYDEAIEKILLDVTKKCGLNYYKECVKPWQTFPLKMQEAIARTMQHRIKEYGK